MTDESGWSALKSFEQVNFVAVARYLAGKLCLQPGVQSGEGIDGSGAENSSLITGCGADQARYLGELLGRYARQKWILVFDAGSGGTERLLIVTFSTDHPADMGKELRRFGITAGTLIAQDQLIRFYLCVKGNSQDAAVQGFAASQHGMVQEIHGQAILIGSDDRGTSQGIFDQRIRAYERLHHLALSRLLRSKRLREMGRQEK